jgi:hypothetical protein
MTLEISVLNSEIKEIDESIAAGELSIRALNKLLDSLQSARNWGTYDILGGGFIATSIKHNKINNARDIADEVNYYLEKFRHELADINIKTSLAVNISAFASFADFFFDGFLDDIFAQRRINSSFNTANEMRININEILTGIKRERKKIPGKTEINRN